MRASGAAPVQAAVAHRPDRVQPGADERVVRRDDQRRADLVADLQQHVRDVVGGGAVELAGGFVGQDQPRARREHPRDDDALRLPAGQLLRQLVAQLVELEQGERGAGAVARVGPLVSVSSSGSSTFSDTVRLGIKVGAWNTRPARCAASRGMTAERRPV